MTIRREVLKLIIWGVLIMMAIIFGMIMTCLTVGERGFHLAVIAILTTSGPLFARIFEGLVRRTHLTRGLDRDCIAAEDEILIARTVPLAMPVVGAMFAYSVMI